ncbi:hypothetical protein KAZ92_03080 [Candidatus Gracilibacteria bacterium]|nr:hypothetical protein [Candidatus Gracilibacteria bacterium]
MLKRIASQFEDVKDRVKALVCLPDSLFRQLTAGRDSHERITRDFQAQHESGHALYLFLADLDMENVRVSRFSYDVRSRLSTLLKGVVSFEPGAVTTEPLNHKAFIEKFPDRNALSFITGIAVPQKPDYQEIVDDDLGELEKGSPVDNTWGDIANPCRYIHNRFTEIHQKAPTDAEVRAIFMILFREVQNIYKEDRFAKALNCISRLVRQHKLKRRVNQRITEAFESEGISQDDIDDMKKKLFSIDIDKVIRDSVLER